VRKAPGAQFEISVDGKPRSYRDRKAVAIEAAEYLKWKNPHTKPQQRIERERCLEATQTRTHWFWHVLYGVGLL
jgi:hypothetical protein